MRRAALGLAAALAAAPVVAAPPAYDIDFVAEFAEACVPGRLSYPGTQETARANGWVEVERSVNAELDAMMAISEREAQDPELQATFEYKLFSKPIRAQDHYLVVSYSSFVIDPDEEPVDPWVLIGCYLYNLDATGPIDPEPVSALIGKPISNSHADETLVGHVWGPPCPMPFTGDTYLTYVAEGSEPAAASGFSGLVLKFSTAEPDAGETVPDTFC